MISKIPYNSRRVPKDAISIILHLNDQSYSLPFDLGGPFSCFGRDQRYFSIGPNWMINLLQSKGQNIEFSGRPKQLPYPFVEHEDGYLLIPFGQQMAMRTCGTSAIMWVESDRAVVEVVAKDAFTGRSIAFQLHFLFALEAVEIHYKSAITGSRTVIGACGKPGEHTEWGCDAYENLSHTAIRIDMTEVETPADVILVDPDVPHTPFGPLTPPSTPVIPETSDDSLVEVTSWWDRGIKYQLFRTKEEIAS